jgi:hypothetical protein
MADVLPLSNLLLRNQACQASSPSPLLAETRITAQRGLTARMWSSIRSMSTGR